VTQEIGDLEIISSPPLILAGSYVIFSSSGVNKIKKINEKCKWMNKRRRPGRQEAFTFF
jgi:hypothetical protein